MKRTGLRLLVLAGFLSSLIGCSGLLGGKTVLPQLRKFIIEAEPLRLNIPESERPYSFKVEVGDFEVSRLYDEGLIDAKTAEAAGVAATSKGRAPRRKTSTRNPKS